MKLKLSQVVDGFTAISRLLTSTEKLPTKLAYAIARNARLLEPEIKTFSDRRLELFKELGKQSEETPEQWEAGDNVVELSERINSLLSEELELLVHQVKLSDAGDTFLANDMLLLDWMFIEEGEG